MAKKNFTTLISDSVTGRIYIEDFSREKFPGRSPLRCASIPEFIEMSNKEDTDGIMFDPEVVEIFQPTREERRAISDLKEKFGDSKTKVVYYTLPSREKKYR